MDVPVIANNYIESHIQEKVNVSNEFNNDNENISKENVNDKPIQINLQEYHSKMNYNQHLSDKKYYLMMVGNFLCIISSIIFIIIFLKNIQYDKIVDKSLLIFILKIILIILSITILILLYDFNKYKKAKNSNDINQYKQYIIDDNNIDQLNKQKRYNFINGLSIGSFLVFALLIFIKEDIIFEAIDNIIELFDNNFDNISHLLFKTIIIITFPLQIIYIILLIIDNKNNIWNSIKQQLFYIVFVVLTFVTSLSLYFLNSYLFLQKLKNDDNFIEIVDNNFDHLKNESITVDNEENRAKKLFIHDIDKRQHGDTIKLPSLNFINLFTNIQNILNKNEPLEKIQYATKNGKIWLSEFNGYYYNVNDIELYDDIKIYRNVGEKKFVEIANLFIDLNEIFVTYKISNIFSITLKYYDKEFFFKFFDKDQRLFYRDALHSQGKESIVKLLSEIHLTLLEKYKRKIEDQITKINYIK